MPDGADVPEAGDLDAISERLGLPSASYLQYLVTNPRTFEVLSQLTLTADPGVRGNHVPTPKAPEEVPYPAVNVPDQTPAPTHRPEPDHFVHGQDVQHVPAEFLPPHRFDAWSLFEDCRVEGCKTELAAWAKTCTSQWQAIYSGQSPTPIKPLIWRSECFKPWVVGRLWNTQVWGQAFLQDISRAARREAVDAAVRTGTAADPGAINEDMQAIGYVDREWLDVIYTGLHSKANLPYAVVLCGPSSTLGQAGAEAAKSIASGIAASCEPVAFGEAGLLGHGTCVETASIVSSIPYSADSVGAAVKKSVFPPKVRQTTNKSGPHGAVADGKPLAFNANVPIRDSDKFPVNRLVRISEICVGLEAIDAIFHALKPHLTARQRRLLEPTMVISDFSGYFTKFMADLSEQCRNGAVYLKPGYGELSSTYSERVQFGGTHAPIHGSRGCNAVTTFLRHAMGLREAQWQRDANWGGDTGFEVARDICPRHLVDIFRSRERLGEGQNIGFFISGYVDDLINGTLGTARLVALTDSIVSMSERWKLPTAGGKYQAGSLCLAIGFKIALRSAELQHTLNRRDLLDKWIRRLREASNRREVVSKTEIQAFTGTWAWAARTIPGSEAYLRRMHKLPFRKDKVGNHLYRLLIDKASDLDLLRLGELLEGSSGVSLLIRERVPVISNPLNLSWTDASREPSGVFSGMGGCDLRVGILWVYQFSQRQIDELPIHILEAIADLVGLALGTGALTGEELLRFCDNKAVVDTVTYEKPSDQGMADFLRLRQELERPKDLTAHSRYVNTHANTVADAPSRGQLGEAVAELNRKGWGNRIRVIDLRKESNRAPPDLEKLFEHFIRVEQLKRVARRASGEGGRIVRRGGLGI